MEVRRVQTGTDLLLFRLQVMRIALNKYSAIGAEVAMIGQFQASVGFVELTPVTTMARAASAGGTKLWFDE